MYLNKLELKTQFSSMVLYNVCMCDVLNEGVNIQVIQQYLLAVGEVEGFLVQCDFHQEKKKIF